MNKHKYDGIDLTNQRHERLLAVKKSDSGRTRWICKCDCGNVVELSAWYFFHNKSCGCLERLNKQNLGKNNATHGMTKSILYHKYCDMKERCYNTNSKAYMHYGGRGIKICDEWLQSFEAFKDWAYANGYDDSKKTYQQTLDREDVNGNYCPDNCRWVTQKVQANNRTNTIYIVYKEKTYTISELSEKYNVAQWFIRRYVKKGKTFEDILDLWESKNRVVNGRVRVRKK